MKQVWEKIWPVLKYLVPLVILAGVGWNFSQILSRSELSETPFALRPGWLALAGVLYLAAHTVWASFSVDVLRSQRVAVPWGAGVRAYFVSQLGKYVPGKAWVIVLRVAMLHRYAPTRVSVALATTYETLTSMGAGALVGLLLLSTLGERADLFAGREPYLVLLVALPMAIGVLHKFISARKPLPAQTDRPRSQFRLILLARGLIQASLGWGLMGLSFWAAVQGLQPELTSLSLAAAGRFTAMIALAYVIGFFALIVPGGVGVREWFVQALLAAELAASMTDPEAQALAVVVALVLRLVWTLAELVLIAGIYFPRRRDNH